MTRSGASRPRSGLKTLSPVDVGLMSRDAPSGGPPSGWTAWLEQEGLAASAVLDPSLCEDGRATVQFRGQRLGVHGRGTERDWFVRDEVVEGILPGSGPVSVTTRVYDINPGEWSVTAEALPSSRKTTGRNRMGHAAVSKSLPSAVWSWRRWSVSPGSPEPVMTCSAPLVKIRGAPGLIPGIWGALVGLGILVAVALTMVLTAREGLSAGRLLLVALIGVLIGGIGAKAWYTAQSPQHRFDGWCIQGFVVGLMVGTIPSLMAANLPIGETLDAASPGIFLAMALGRVGRFFAGCCGGPPTASRWALWSSDQRVGARRVPTQLLESAFALAIGATLLFGVLTTHPAVSGALLVSGLAAYTLGRQGILQLRVEARRSQRASAAIAVVAAAVLLAGAAMLFISPG